MLKVIAVGFSLYAAYSFWVSVGLNNYIPIVGAILSAAAAVGLWLHKPWSQYFVYVVSTGFIIQWVWVIVFLASNGWPFSSVSQSVISLVPGLCMAVFAIGSSVFAFRSFRVRR